MGASNRKPLTLPEANQSQAESFGPVLVGPPKKRPGMRKAITEARHEVAWHLPQVVQALANEALKGSVTHLKLFLELSGLLKGGLAAPEKQVRERTLEEIIVGNWEEEKAIVAAEQAERNRARAEEVLSGL